MPASKNGEISGSIMLILAVIDNRRGWIMLHLTYFAASDSSLGLVVCRGLFSGDAKTQELQELSTAALERSSVVRFVKARFRMEQEAQLG